MTDCQCFDFTQILTVLGMTIAGAIIRYFEKKSIQRKQETKN